MPSSAGRNVWPRLNTICAALDVGAGARVRSGLLLAGGTLTSPAGDADTLLHDDGVAPSG